MLLNFNYLMPQPVADSCLLDADSAGVLRLGTSRLSVNDLNDT